MIIRCKKILLGAVCFAILLFISSASLQVINAQENDLDKQLELLQDFLDLTLNPRTRTAYDGVFTGGLWGTPHGASMTMGYTEFDDHFIVEVVNESDVLNENLKEVISNETGIPIEIITFMWLDPDSFEPSIRIVSFEEMAIESPALASSYLKDMKNNPQDYSFSQDEIKEFDNFLRNRSVYLMDEVDYEAQVNPMDISELMEIAPRIQFPIMGDRATAFCPRAGGWIEFTIGHPRNSSGTLFFTSTHGYLFFCALVQNIV